MALSKIQFGNTGRRNLIINGAMQIAQRATSATGVGVTPNYNTVDRWRFADASNPPSRFTETQSTDAPEGFSFSRKYEVTTIDASPADDDMQYTDQFIEAQNLQHLKYGTSNAESVTLSFYVKSSVASTMGLRFTHEDGGGSYGATYTINATNTWERKTITVPGNTATAINNDNGRGLRIAFGLSVGANNAGSNSTAWGNGSLFGAHTNTFVGTANATWQITGVQLEVGSAATEFEHLSFDEELRLCSRYYRKIGRFMGGGREGYSVSNVTFTPGMRLTGSDASNIVSTISAGGVMYSRASVNNSTGTLSGTVSVSTTATAQAFTAGFAHNGASTGSTYNGTNSGVYVDGLEFDAEL